MAAPRSRILLAVIGTLAVVILGGLGIWAAVFAPRARQAEVAERGAAV